MEMQVSNATEFPLYHHSMATGPHSFQLPGAIPPVSTIPTYKNTMFPDRFYYDSAGVTPHHHAMPAERCDRCYAELSVTGGGHHFGKRLCGMCAAKEQQQVSPKVDTEILDLDSQQVMSQQQQRQQQQQDTSKAFLQQHGGVVVPSGYDRPPQPPPPPPPAVEWPGYFQPQQNSLSGEHLSPDYNNVSTTTTTPPTMMGGSPPSDMQQQQYQANFDGGGGGGYAIDSNQPPGGGGSGSGGGSSGTKGNGSWKSNEARRAKTYECPACDKWFTSSGHLKRHYGTQLHKNAVKQSGKPDPALLPMKHHYHPYRDPAYVAQQKLKQQQQNGSSLHKQQQQQSSMMMPADFRPVTSSTSSSFNTDSFLELTPPNLTASLSDSLGGTQYLPARRPVSNSSSSSNSNSSNNSTAGFTDEMQISSYPCHSNKYRADPTVARTAARHQVTSYPDHRQPTAGQQALSAYLHHQNTDTIQPYTTQVSMIQAPTNTDLYTTMPDNSGHHVYHDLQQPPPYHLQQQQHTVARDQLIHRQLPPPPPSRSHHHRQPVHRQQSVIDYQKPSSTTLPSPYQQQQQQQPQPQHQLQQQCSIVKQEPVEYNADDAPMASPDSSIDHHNHHQNHLQHLHQQQQHHHHHHQQQQQHHHQHQQYRGLLVVAPVSPASPPPTVPLLTTPHAAAADDDTAVSDCSVGSVDLDAGGSPQSLCGHVLSPSSSTSSSSKKLRKATRVKCDICNKDFTDKCYKTQHDQRFHSGEKPYRCSVCGKRFGEHKLLQVHELRHNDSNKAFPCTVCTKSFNFKNDLDRHFMSSHSADKPYQCVQCDKKFVRLDHKRHHEKTHDDAVDKMTKKKKKTSSPMAVADGRCYDGQLHMHLAEDQS